MMFLYSGIRAEVEPVPGKRDWYQLTGKHIERWTVDVMDTFGDLRGTKVKVNHTAKILGIHDVDPEIELRDPRFNEENNEDEGNTFGVYTEGGRTYMLLAVNQAEYALFRFLCPHEAGGPEADEKYDPIENYRIEPPAPKAQTKKATQPKVKSKA
jgi:hypothetical protein